MFFFCILIIERIHQTGSLHWNLTHTIYDGGEKGAGGDVNLIVNEEPAVSTRINRTIPSQFSIDEGADVACDRGSPVAGHQLGPNRNSRFTGEVKKVTLEINPKR